MPSTMSLSSDCPGPGAEIMTPLGTPLPPPLHVRHVELDVGEDEITVALGVGPGLEDGPPGHELWRWSLALLRPNSTLHHSSVLWMSDVNGRRPLFIQQRDQRDLTSFEFAGDTMRATLPREWWPDDLPSHRVSAGSLYYVEDPATGDMRLDGFETDFCVLDLSAV